MAVSTQTRGESTSSNKMTPEIYFARKLASNDKKIRDKTLKKLRKWITARSSVPDAFSEEELLKLWKGLFYCMWMSDKPLIQEDLAEMISSLVHCIEDRQTGLRFVKIALQTLAKDWPGIDNWRMDKFLMFVRRIIRHSLEYLANQSWKNEEVAAYAQILSDTIVNANLNSPTFKTPLGLQLHVVNLFPEELAKAAGSDLSSEVVLKFLEPFVNCLATSDDFRLRKDITEHVFMYLIKQSDEGLEYESGNNGKSTNSSGKAQKDAEETIDHDLNEPNNEDLEGEEGVDSDDQEMENDDEEEGNPDWGAKDPRAGGVDVVLPQLKPDYSQLANMFFNLAANKKVRAKNRKTMYRLVQWFKDLASGVYPLQVDLPEVGPGLTPKLMKQAARHYIKDELKLSDQRALEKELGRKRKNINNGEQSENHYSPESPEGDIDSSADSLDDTKIVENSKSDGNEDKELSSDEEEEVEESSGQNIEDNMSTRTNDKASIKKKKPKTSDKGPKEQTAMQTFEVEENWEDEENDKTNRITSTAICKLKKKLKTSKRPLSSGWTESPLQKKEVEIVIPVKKAKVTEKNSEPMQIEDEAGTLKNSSTRRVNFVLNKNMSQEPKDYQESIRKSPGVPHDPDRQPSRGGVLKQKPSIPAQKLTFDKIHRKTRTRKV